MIRPFRATLALSVFLAAAVLPLTSGCGSSELQLESDASSTQASDSQRAYSFEVPGPTAPAGWRVATTNGGPNTEAGRWEVRLDESAPSPPSSLALLDARGHSGSEFNLCWDPARSLVDVDVSVAVQANGGVEDQGGGPAWRISDADNYYVARWNPLEDNFRVYSVVAGHRVELDSAEVRADPEAWHTIRIRQVGASITCWFDGEELLHATDDELVAPGAVGLWTKADATTSFDDLTVSSATR